MGSLVQHLRHAFRRLIKSPGFTAVALTTLALGIGANAALFSIFDQLVLRELPVQRPEELVVVQTGGSTSGRWSQTSLFSEQPFSYPMYKDLREQSPLTRDLAGRFVVTLAVGWGGNTEVVGGELVSGNYFELLGVRPHLGRLFSMADDQAKLGHPVAVLSHGAWRRRFGADPAIAGKTVTINGQAFTIVGVAESRFRSVQVGATPEIFVTMAMKPVITPGWDDLDRRRAIWVDVFGRLKPGATREQATAALQPIYRRLLEAEYEEMKEPSSTFKERFLAKPIRLDDGSRGRSDLRGDFSRNLAVLFGMVGLVLLVACANLANLLAARGSGRRREIAVRAAIGASSKQLAAESLCESLLLALAGGALGVAVARFVALGLLRFSPDEGLLDALSLAPDARMIGFSFAVALGTGLLFGWLPAREASRVDLNTRLREESGNATAALAGSRWRRGLIVGQVALSTVLLIGAGLFSRSLSSLLRLDPGFEPRGVLSFTVDPGLNGYDPQRSRSLLLSLEERLGELPGVDAVALADTALLSGSSNSNSLEAEGYKAAEDEHPSAYFNAVTPGYFDAMGLRLRAGRGFADSDRAGTEAVAVVNRKFAQGYFKGEDPIGRRLRIDDDRPWVTIVGMVEDTAWRNLREERRSAVFVPIAQNFVAGGPVYDAAVPAVVVYLRTAGDPLALANPARRVLRELDPQLPIDDLLTVEQQLDQSVSVERAARAVSIAFAVLATVLASLGLYGVLAYAVARRTREMGVRMALGAANVDLFKMILGDGLRPVILGLTIGLGVALPLGRLVKALLYGVQAADATTFVTVVPVLLAAAVAACLLPARRAARTEPLRALRYE
jgi:predicted permease